MVAQKRQWERCTPWEQRAEPPQSLQVERRRPWTQMEVPPQGLH